MGKIGTTPRKKLYDKIYKVIRELCLIRHPYCVTCKGQNKRYDASYKPNTQTTLFLED